MLIVGVAVAGALAALSRWGISLLMVRWMGSRLPYGTLCVNLIGCFAMGLLMELAERAQWLGAETRIIVAVGFIGTLTTFSSWEYETWRLARRGEVLWAAGNFAANVFFGFLLIWAGGRLIAAVLG